MGLRCQEGQGEKPWRQQQSWDSRRLDRPGKKAVAGKPIAKR